MQYAEVRLGRAVDRAAVRPRQTVLVRGGAGGVGQLESAPSDFVRPASAIAVVSACPLPPAAGAAGWSENPTNLPFPGRDAKGDPLRPAPARGWSENPTHTEQKAFLVNVAALGLASSVE